MYSTIRIVLLSVLSCSLFFSAGCAGKKKGSPLDPGITGNDPPPLVPLDGFLGTDGTLINEDYGLPPGLENLPFAKISELQVIYFAYDSAHVEGSERSKADAAVAWLANNPTRYLRIEGHCDERGSNDYNLALGERRAQAVRNYLIEMGADPARIITISYGEEMPAVAGHNESSWQQNRRAEFAGH